MRKLTYVGLLESATVLLLIGSVLNHLPTRCYVQEINANLGAYYLGAHAVLCLAWLPYLRNARWRRAALLLGLQIALVWSYWVVIAGFYNQAQPSEDSPLLAQRALSIRGLKPEGANLKVVSANVYLHNARLTDAAEAIAAQDADIVVLSEYSRTLRSTVLFEKYAYRKIVSGFGAHDIALFSKYPWSDSPITSVSSEGEDLPPIVFARIEAPIPCLLLGLHLLPPLTQQAFYDNELLVRRSSLLLRHENLPKIVLGDLNATPFSKNYKRLLTAARLENAFTGLGFLRSWHADRPELRLSLDHILYGGPLWREGAARFEVPGSDHFGLVAEFRAMPRG